MMMIELDKGSGKSLGKGSGKSSGKGSGPEIVTLSEPIKAIGLLTKTGMKTVFRDITEILKKYMGYKDKHGIPNQKKPWEYVSLSTNFNEYKSWDYYTGHVVSEIADNIPEVFIPFEVPAGSYAVFKIRPRFKFLLGMEIGKTKRYIYNEWLKKSEYEFTGSEFEYNDEKMFSENPHYINLFVAVKRKQ